MPDLFGGWGPRESKLNTAIQFLLYGIYAVLFGICVYILLARKQRNPFLLAAMILLFLLASTDVALTTVYDLLLLDSVTSTHTSEMNLYFAHYLIILVNNALADAILGCFKGFSFHSPSDFIIPIVNAMLHFVEETMEGHWSSCDLATVGFIVHNGTGAISVLGSVMVAGATIVNNLVLSSLIAFRIYRMSRSTMTYLGPRPKNLYKMLIAISLESGIFYAAWLFVGFTLSFIQVPGFFDGCLRTWPIIASMMPTIIVVRVALGISFGDTESPIMSLRESRDSDMNFERGSVMRISRRHSFDSVASLKGAHV
uniref:G protein-coupled receptor n=1 Tax=Moniliophthora roreri TaxID=221103 RepID=A0A0W0G6M2_MONRR